MNRRLRRARLGTGQSAGAPGACQRAGSVAEPAIVTLTHA
jgi:hypothetical protein